MMLTALIKINLLLLFMIILSHCQQVLKDSMESSRVLTYKFPLKRIYTGMLLGNGVQGLMIRRYSHILTVANELAYNNLIKNEKLVDGYRKDIVKKVKAHINPNKTLKINL